ncbi:transposase [Sulfitobacter sp. HI0076]|uniref:IS91 family transposase n=4 Tax=Pseudomonadota TaxID=1224 RepID=UPI0007C37A02|nr:MULTISPECIES: IS91 family transposase [Alphaproteobacteria]KZX99871.1 transposase [Sulfitobacter sp. HI0027]KZY99272.1 transposase [Sulfitobacter sp. HI0076]PHR72138.1 MAG: IS91 family transposase [Henriciella sp.]WPZ32108.1 IS91 family transposase [Sulfitobacter sp. OXR-159]
MPRPSLEVADIFRAHGAAWLAANVGHISLDQLKVMSAIERCRTAALGGHVARCEDCAHEHIAYNSCRNRHCPKCQSGAARAWLAAREAELLPVRYFHLVFTLPKPIADIAHQNKREIYNLLMRASADAVIRIAADPKHLGARVGVTSVLHTWGSAMTHHPHVHMIVPGGGLSEDGTKWIACRKNFFLSVRVLSRLYRRLILDGLSRLHKAGKLRFFGDHAKLADLAVFDAFLQPLRKIDWVVYAKEPFAGPKAVLAYLSRYTHRVAISNSRLIRVDDRGVTFRVKDYRITGPGRHTTMTLKTDEFIRRFLIHVLPKGQHRIRHYGFFGNGNRTANIARIRELLGAETPVPGLAHDNTIEDADAPARVLALPCPCCGGRLIIVDTFAPAQHPRAPPASARAAA